MPFRKRGARVSTKPSRRVARPSPSRSRGCERRQFVSSFAGGGSNGGEDRRAGVGPAGGRGGRIHQRKDFAAAGWGDSRADTSRGGTRVMWRFAKRFAVRAARTAGRNAGAGVRSGPAREPREGGGPRREGAVPSRTQTCESLVQLGTRWELEAAASARRGTATRGGTRGRRRARGARHGQGDEARGVRWVDIATNPAVRRELGDAARHACGTRRRRNRRRPRSRGDARGEGSRRGPTLALRHAGGSATASSRTRRLPSFTGRFVHPSPCREERA